MNPSLALPKSPAICRSMNTGTCASIAPGPSPPDGIRRAQAARTNAHSAPLKYTGLYSSSRALAACVADGPPASSTAPLPTAAFSMKRRLGRLSGGFNACHVVGGCRSSFICALPRIAKVRAPSP